MSQVVMDPLAPHGAHRVSIASHIIGAGSLAAVAEARQTARAGDAGREVEAFQVTAGVRAGQGAWPLWLREALAKHHTEDGAVYAVANVFYVNTPAAAEVCRDGDWIVLRADGSLSVHKGAAAR